MRTDLPSSQLYTNHEVPPYCFDTGPTVHFIFGCAVNASVAAGHSDALRSSKRVQPSVMAFICSPCIAIAMDNGIVARSLVAHVYRLGNWRRMNLISQAPVEQVACCAREFVYPTDLKVMHVSVGADLDGAGYQRTGHHLLTKVLRATPQGPQTTTHAQQAYCQLPHIRPCKRPPGAGASLEPAPT